ncbi:hypothetical protein EDB85DRAFT_2149184 [Lactarius pseudohatsudake]|nr:hypothetical protein EDB85DRAFT_2149184 [Lactarius pseudohatsudake]
MACNTPPPPTRHLSLPQHLATANPLRHPNTACKTFGPMPFVHHGSQHTTTANPPRCFNTARKTFGPIPIHPCPNTPPPPTQHLPNTARKTLTAHPPPHCPKRQSDTARNGTPTPCHVTQHPADPPCPFNVAHTAQPPPTPTPTHRHAKTLPLPTRRVASTWRATPRHLPTHRRAKTPPPLTATSPQCGVQDPASPTQ